MRSAPSFEIIDRPAVVRDDDNDGDEGERSATSTEEASLLGKRGDWKLTGVDQELHAKRLQTGAQTRFPFVTQAKLRCARRQRGVLIRPHQAVVDTLISHSKQPLQLAIL